MSTAGISANKLELLQIANAVAQEKSIDKSIVLEAIEEAIQKAARLRYGSEQDIRAKLNPVTGEMDLKRVITVVAEVENEITEVDLVSAQLDNPDVVIGHEFVTELPPIEFGRVQSQMAKQVIMQKVRDAERARQYAEFKDRVGEIINGIVKRVEYGHISSHARMNNLWHSFLRKKCPRCMMESFRLSLSPVTRAAGPKSLYIQMTDLLIR